MPRHDFAGFAKVIVMALEVVMDSISPAWLGDFDAAMVRFFLIDHVDAGMGEAELLRYADLAPEAAALQFGEDYELQRVDVGWRAL